jgi:hypothetical protein
MVSPSPVRARKSASAEIPSEAANTLPEGPARVAFGGRIVPGRVLSPETEVGFVAFVPDDPEIAAPEEGEMVRLAFGPGARWSAKSEVMDAEGAHWFLTLPKGLGTAKRAATRQPANGDWEFFADEDVMDFDAEVHDISVEGVGLLLAPGQPLGSAGRTIPGRLVRCDGKAFRVTAEIRNIRRHAHSPDWKVVGCAITLGAAERDALAEVLAEDA